MVKNNHPDGNRRKIDELLRSDTLSDSPSDSLSRIIAYARMVADIENSIVVVSDMSEGRSHIIMGGFARSLNLEDYRNEDSIWERRILSLMSPDEQDKKYLAELRFYHYLRHVPKCKKSEYILCSKLRFRSPDGEIHDVLHRMHYIFDDRMETVRYAICTYGPLCFDFPGNSMAINSVTGTTEEITVSDSSTILSTRQKQVLTLIDTGMRSAEIASRLNISIHTVSRHRQEILAKLQVKNTHEACRLAKNLHII